MEKIEKMSVAELVATEEYRSNLDKVIEDICGIRLKLANEARRRDRKLKRHPFDRLLEEADLSPEALGKMFLAALEKKLDRPVVIRDLVMNIGMEAYKRTMDAEVKKNPKLKKKFRKFVK